MEKILQQEMNAQINRELFSAYLYLAMVAYLEAENLNGFAHWMRIQALEEMTHAMKFFNYVSERAGKIVLETIEKPAVKISSVKDVFEQALQHEKYITKSINTLYALAKKENDNATVIFLEWFVTEQVEEEKNASEIIGKLKYTGDRGEGILMLDKELSLRLMPVLTPSGTPAATA